MKILLADPDIPEARMTRHKTSSTMRRTTTAHGRAVGVCFSTAAGLLSSSALPALLLLAFAAQSHNAGAQQIAVSAAGANGQISAEQIVKNMVSRACSHY
jgi:hypothetical protein